jgi:cytoskeleton protein RodZ
MAGLSLEQVAQQLKLAPRQVRALEEDDFAQLPGRTFARGFVRNYARLLNLDGEDLLATLPDAARALEAPALLSTGTMIAELPAARIVQPGVTRWAIPIVLVACIVGAATYEWYRGGASPQEVAPRSASPAISPEVGAAPSTAAVSAPPAPTATAAAPTTASTELPNPLAVAASPAAPAEPPTPGMASAEAATLPADAASVQGADQTLAAASAADAPGAPLQLTYRGPSWTEIRDRNGQVLMSRVVAAGSEQSIRGAAPFDIVIGNATVVTLTYHGAPVDLTRYTHQNVARLRLT